MSSICYSQQWSVVPSISPDVSRNLLRGVWGNSSNDVWAVGETSLLPIKTLVQHWNGTEWTLVNSPSPGTQTNVLVAVEGTSSDNVYAVGYKSNNSTPQMLVVHWDGSSWEENSAPTVTGGSGLQTICVFSPDDIYAGGYKAVGAPGPTTGNLITHWNGSAWSIEDSPNQSSNRSNYITDIKGISPDDIWAVGYSRTITGNFKNMVLHKTGSSWDIISVPQPGLENHLYNLDIIASDNIRITCQFNDGSQYTACFLHFDGSNWTVESSPGGGADIIHNSANDIWSTGSNIVHYDGTSWSEVSAPVPAGGSMLSMIRISSADVWAVGRFIDGEDMKSLIMHFGGTTSISGSDIISDNYELSQNYPNPFNPVTVIRYSLSANTPVELKIYNSLGKEITELVNEIQNTGTHSVEWNAAGFPSGIYFYTISANDFKDTKRMILLK